MPGSEVTTSKVVVHPLVLLSVVDHFNRMGKIGNQKRVVGVLLGCWKAKGILDVSNSFAEPLLGGASLCVISSERYIDHMNGCLISLFHETVSKLDFKSSFYMAGKLLLEEVVLTKNKLPLSYFDIGQMEDSFLLNIPFDEDDKDKSVWFLDHDYLENMYGMFKKVNARERVVGWYHTGPKLHQNDIAINELVRRYCPNSVLVIIDAKPKDLGLPTEAYQAVEEVHDDGSPTSKTFEHVPSEIGAEEAEEVGVEHLLRDIKDTTVGTLSQRITNQLLGLKGLHSQLQDIRDYLIQISEKKLPINHQIIYQLQDIFNLLPDINHEAFNKSFYVKNNDQMLVVYLAALVRSIVALHNLINNKLTNKDAEEGKKEEKKDKDNKDKDKDGKDKDTKKEEKKK